MAKKKDEAVIPKSIMDGILPLCKKLRAVKDALDKLSIQKKKLSEEEEYIEQMLTTKLTSEGLASVKTIYGTASTSENTYPSIKDFSKMMAWIIKHKRFDLLPKSLKTAAWRESYESGDVIPGVEVYKEDKLSFRRSSKKKEA